MSPRVKVGRWLAGDNTAIITRDKTIAMLKKENMELATLIAIRKINDKLIERGIH